MEALVGRAQELKGEMGDDFVSVEHLLLAYPDDARFGASVLQAEGLDDEKLREAVKAVRHFSVNPCANVSVLACSGASVLQAEGLDAAKLRKAIKLVRMILDVC